MDHSNPLGTYLRARRGLVTPESVGIRASTRRRVPGLTREELAVTTGISVEYYTRLEQGKDRRPSAQIVAALASALQLDTAATAFLSELSRDDVSSGEAVEADGVPDGIVQLLSIWRSTPAFVIGRFGTVLAAAPAVAELTPACRPGANMFREIFLAPESRRRYVNWHAFTAVLVAALRAASGRDVEAQQLVALVAELERESPRFRELWHRHDATPASGGRTVIDHPTEGLIELQVHTLTLAMSAFSVVVYHAEPGSADEAAVLRLVARSDPARSVDEA